MGQLRFLVVHLCFFATLISCRAETTGSTATSRYNGSVSFPQQSTLPRIGDATNVTTADAALAMGRLGAAPPSVIMTMLEDIEHKEVQVVDELLAGDSVQMKWSVADTTFVAKRMSVAAMTESQEDILVEVVEGMSMAIPPVVFQESALEMGSDVVIVAAPFGRSAIEGLHPASVKYQEEANTGSGAPVTVVSAMDINLFDAKGVVRSVKDLPKPIIFELPFRIPPPPASQPVECAYWDESVADWLTEGVKVVSVSNMSVRCSTIHLTLFGAVYRGFAGAFECSQAELLTREGTEEFFRSSRWMSTKGALIVWFYVLGFLFLLCMARNLDRLRRDLWSDGAFLIPDASKVPDQAFEDGLVHNLRLAADLLREIKSEALEPFRDKRHSSKVGAAISSLSSVTLLLARWALHRVARLNACADCRVHYGDKYDKIVEVLELEMPGVEEIADEVIGAMPSLMSIYAEASLPPTQATARRADEMIGGTLSFRSICEEASIAPRSRSKDEWLSEKGVELELGMAACGSVFPEPPENEAVGNKRWWRQLPSLYPRVVEPVLLKFMAFMAPSAEASDSSSELDGFEGVNSAMARTIDPIAFRRKQPSKSQFQRAETTRQQSQQPQQLQQQQTQQEAQQEEEPQDEQRSLPPLPKQPRLNRQRQPAQLLQSKPSHLFQAQPMDQWEPQQRQKRLRQRAQLLQQPQLQLQLQLQQLQEQPVQTPQDHEPQKQAQYSDEGDQDQKLQGPLTLPQHLSLGKGRRPRQRQVAKPIETQMPQLQQELEGRVEEPEEDLRKKTRQRIQWDLPEEEAIEVHDAPRTLPLASHHTHRSRFTWHQSELQSERLKFKLRREQLLLYILQLNRILAARQEKHEDSFGNIISLPCFVARPFFTLGPVGRCFVFSIFIRCSTRVLLLCNRMVGAAAVTTFFLAQDGVPSASNPLGCLRSPDVSAVFGRLLAIGVTSVLFAEVPVAILSMLLRRRFKAIDYIGSAAYKRQLRVWRFRDMLLWTFSIIYILFCIYYCLLFIANVAVDHHILWLVTAGIGVLNHLFIFPFILAMIPTSLAATVVVVICLVGGMTRQEAVAKVLGCDGDVLEERSRRTNPSRARFFSWWNAQRSDESIRASCIVGKRRITVIPSVTLISSEDTDLKVPTEPLDRE